MLTLNRKLRPHSFFLWQGTQDGFATAPSGDIIDTDLPGAAPTWSRQSAGQYQLTFLGGSLSEDYCVAFVQIRGTSAAMIAHVSTSDGNLVSVKFRDAAGAFIEADCSFTIMVLNYTATIPA